MELWSLHICGGRGIGEGRGRRWKGAKEGGVSKSTICTEWQGCSSKCVPKCELLCIITV